MSKLSEVFQKIGIRIKPKPSEYDYTNIRNPKDDITELTDSSNMLDLQQFQSFRTIASDRETQYRVYDEMALDSIIASALEMYADDATQYNSKGDIIWAESDDNDVAAFANRLIDIFNLNANAWTHIYSMVKYGDLYLKLFRDTDVDNNSNYTSGPCDIKINKPKRGSVLDEYIEMENNPAEIFDLVRRGKTVGFVRVPTNDRNPIDQRYSYQYKTENNIGTIIEPADRYIHISLTNNIERFPEELEIQGTDSEGNDVTYSYRIRRGKSILHDIYKCYKELSLMEDSLLLNRVTRSSIIRLLQIEVGDMPKNQTRETLKRMKTLIEQHNYMDKNDGTYTSMASPGPIDNVLYIPTRDGKGSISASNLGGDVDVKSIADIDYYKNKLYGGLKIPKQFLGDDMEGSGLSAGTSLTKLDSRYARTIKRIQNAYISGITDLINIYALSKGLHDHVNNFTIKMVSPSTIEDAERDETLSNRMDMASTFLDLISDEEMFSNETRKDVLKYFVNSYLNEPEISEILEKDKTASSNQDDNFDSNKSNDSFDSSSFSSSTTNNFDNDFEDTSDFESDEDSNSDFDLDSPTKEPEINDNEEFGDFEDEF